MKKNLIAFSIKLPNDFRIQDFLSFHQRDPQQVSERVAENCLEKTWVFRKNPFYIRFMFEDVLVNVEIDGKISATEATLLVNRMLGLQQPTQEFEEKFLKHPVLGQAIQQHRGLRIALTGSVFEALSWAITGQQISVAAAVSVRRKLVQAANIRHSSGLYCYPDAQAISTMSEETLRSLGFSSAKAATLKQISELIISGTLSLEPQEEDISPQWAQQQYQQLLSIKGIGPWTVHYTLLRGTGFLDGSLHGDAAVRKGLGILQKKETKPSEKETQQWLNEFQPWRALVAAHLWAIKSIQA
jgi:DNA-3-methyladenine glycosylase II